MQDRRVRFFYRLKILFVRDNDRCAVQITINVAPLFERGYIGRISAAHLQLQPF